MSFAIIGVVTAVAGTAVSVYGQQQQAQAAEDTAEYNSKLALQQAAHETEVATENARRKARENARVIGLQRQAISANGLAMSGTPLAILGDSVMTLERDILDMGYEAAARAAQLRGTAAMELWEGSATASALRTASVGTAISGISKAGESFLGATGRNAPKKSEFP
jgi:hypothetical protein